MTKDNKGQQIHNVSKHSHKKTVADFFTPENITIIISIITAGIGVAATTIKAIHVWVDERKSRKIRIKYRDVEMEISGAISEDEIYKKLQIFNQFRHKIKKDEVEIILLEENKPNKTNAADAKNGAADL